MNKLVNKWVNKSIIALSLYQYELRQICKFDMNVLWPRCVSDECGRVEGWILLSGRIFQTRALPRSALHHRGNGAVRGRAGGLGGVSVQAWTSVAARLDREEDPNKGQHKDVQKTWTCWPTRMWEPNTHTSVQRSRWQWVNCMLQALIWNPTVVKNQKTRDLWWQWSCTVCTVYVFIFRSVKQIICLLF